MFNFFYHLSVSFLFECEFSEISGSIFCTLKKSGSNFLHFIFRIFPYIGHFQFLRAGNPRILIPIFLNIESDLYGKSSRPIDLQIK